MLPKSALAGAVHYTLSQANKLSRFLDDGRIAIDNSAAERAIKPFVIGRKGWMFATSPQGAEASAILYSLVETAKANGLVPFDYLHHLLITLPTLSCRDQLDALLPWNVGLPRS